MAHFEMVWLSGRLLMIMAQPKVHFTPPGLMARVINRLYGKLASVGIGPSYSFLLLTKGRKSGMTLATPVNILLHKRNLYLVGTRGHTQWSRNALAAGRVTLKRGRTRIDFRLRAIPDREKSEILKAYLIRFNWMVARFFSVGADAPVDSFAAIAADYPVFELLREK
jgi:deazaflavin-dependent oxidoreductase (nitroreductase family)